jgi:ferredoxin
MMVTKSYYDQTVSQPVLHWNLLKARILEPEETSIVREQHMTQCFLCGLCHVPTPTGMHRTAEELKEAVFSTWSTPRLHMESILSCQFSPEASSWRKYQLKAADGHQHVRMSPEVEDCPVERNPVI